MKQLLTILLLLITGLTHAADIPFTLDKPGNVSAAIYDAQGRMVRELLHAAPRNPGKHSLIWDGLDRDGNALPAGDYTWKLLQTPGLKATYLMSLGSNFPPGDDWRTACGPGTHHSPFGIAVEKPGFMSRPKPRKTSRPACSRCRLMAHRGSGPHCTRVRGTGRRAWPRTGGRSSCSGIRLWEDPRLKVKGNCDDAGLPHTFTATADGTAALLVDRSPVLEQKEAKPTREELTGQPIKLLRRRLPISLTHTVGHEGGGIKLEWSTPFQSRQAVPSADPQCTLFIISDFVPFWDALSPRRQKSHFFFGKWRFSWRVLMNDILGK